MKRSLRHRSLWFALAGAAALSLALTGCSGGDSGESSSGSGSQASSAKGGADDGGEGGATTAGTGGGGATAPMSSGMGGMTGPGMMGPGGPMGGGAGGGAQGGAAQTAAKPKTITPPPHRGDPFAPWWDTRPVPPPVLTYTAPVRIAVAESSNPINVPDVEIQEVPSRRVAGILTGSGIYALLDGGPEGPIVVKPGDTVGETGYRVASINANSITLRRKEGGRVYTQVVPLTDAGSSLPSRPAGGIGGPGMSGMPGMSAPPGFGGGRPGVGKGGGGAD